MEEKSVHRHRIYPKDIKPKLPGHIRFVHISDTHNKHDRIKIPPGDVLIHSGDFSYHPGTKRQVAAFAQWFAQQDYEYKIIIAGNHEWTFELQKEAHFKKLIAGNPTDP
jgi:dienelactone hydrolase